GIDYGLGTPWEIDVPDDSIVIENTDENRIPPALADVPQAVRDAIRNPMGTTPLADQVNSSSKVALILNDWMGATVHAVPAAREGRRAAGVNNGNTPMSIAGGSPPKVTRAQFSPIRFGQAVNPPYPSPYHILPPEVIDRFWPTGFASSRIRPHDAADREHL